MSTSHKRSPGNKASLFVLTASILFGTQGTAQAFAPATATPAMVGGVRLFIGGIGLLISAFIQGQVGYSELPLKKLASVAMFVALNSFCLFTAFSKAGVAIGTTVFMGSVPVIAGVVGYLIYRERPRSRWLVATTLAIVGCFLLGGAGTQKPTDVSGIIFAICAAVAYVAYAMQVKGLMKTHPVELIMGSISLMAALLFVPLLFLVDITWMLEARGVSVALYLGFITTMIAYALLARGLSMLPISTTATLTLAEPVVATFLGVFLLGEQLTPLALLGCGIIICSLLTIASQKQPLPD